MKKITQTGRIPISSIGLIIGNYLRYFKVFFVFYIVPMSIFFVGFIVINKEKFFTLLKSALGAFMALKMAAGNPAAIQIALAPFLTILEEVIRTPSFIILCLVSMIVMFICSSCMLVGLKHTFYDKVSISAIAKEGLSKVFDLLWTGISMSLVLIVSLICLGAIVALPAYILRDQAILLVLPLIVFVFIVVSMFTFYVPIHFFADNNPFSSAWLSCKTFWSNFGFMFVFGIVMGIIFFLVHVVIGIIAIFILRHYMPMLPASVLIGLIANLFLPILSSLFPYIGSASVYWLNCIIIFIAYPELLDEDKIEGSPVNSFGAGSNGGRVSLFTNRVF